MVISCLFYSSSYYYAFLAFCSVGMLLLHTEQIINFYELIDGTKHVPLG